MSNIAVVIPPKEEEGIIKKQQQQQQQQDQQTQDQINIEKIYKLWFGAGNIRSPKYSHLVKLWFGSNHMIDKKIKDQFESLLLEARESKLTNQPNGLYQRFKKSPRGRLALIIIFDQFSRNIYRGTKEMFAFDPFALELAMETVNGEDKDIPDYQAVYSLPERLFLYIPFEHSEVLENVKRSVVLYSNLVDECSIASKKKYQEFSKAARDHMDCIEKFNRYPHRNHLLGRESTPQELVYMNESQHAFTKSVQPINPQDNSNNENQENGNHDTVTKENQLKPKTKKEKKAKPIVVESTKPKLKLLFLHGFKQNGTILKKATKKLSNYIGDIATIYYANAPLSYNPTENVRTQLLSAFGEVPETSHQRQWWNSSPDNKVYHHLDASIYFITQLYQKCGPFDGIIGFSQGSALTGILASMQQNNLLPFNIKFAICISGFPSRADIHKDQMVPNYITGIPSLHILGKTDQLVDNDRTRSLAKCFANSVTIEHDGGHFSPAKWSNDKIRSFLLEQYQTLYGDASQAPVVIPVNPLDRLSTFEEMIEAAVTYQKYTGKVVPCGISNETRALLLNTPQLAGLVADPQVTPSQVDVETLIGFIKSFDNKSKDELLMVIWSTRSIGFKKNEPKENPLFYQFWLQLYLHNQEVALKNLQLFPKYGSWRDLQITYYYCLKLESQLKPTTTTTATTPETAVEQEEDKTLSLLKQLKQIIVEKIAHQLQADYRLMFEDLSNQDVEGQDSTPLDSMQPKWPSNCALEAPRMCGNRNGNSSLMAKHIARYLNPTPPNLTGPQLLTAKVHASESYRKLVNSLTNLLKRNTPGFSDKKIESITRDLFARNGASVLLEEDRQKILESSPSSFILNPEAEPIFPCAREDLDPLLDFLNGNQPINQPVVKFTRGTCLPDGRLDLCKQCVGPEGIAPLLNAMKKSESIKRLLLGNNIVGNGGAESIADYIKYNTDSKIDTWYIAGNNFDAQGIKLICDALETDTKVKALWLKRNPLLSAGARIVGKMLEKNTFIVTLDLLNCGILDAGVESLFESLTLNKTLKHLYIDTNGLTVKSATTIKNHLQRGDNHLESLYVSCNQLGDKGAIEIAKGLAVDKSLIRIGLGSNCIGPVGAKALVDAIIPHPTLLALNLGFTKATFQVGALNNILGDEGAVEVARLIAENRVIRSIDLTHNAISQKGLAKLSEALETNDILTTLVHTQIAMVHNEYTKESIASKLLKNRLLFGKSIYQQQHVGDNNNVGGENEWLSIGNKEAESIDAPPHVVEILSVYRTK